MSLAVHPQELATPDRPLPHKIDLKQESSGQAHRSQLEALKYDLLTLSNERVPLRAQVDASNRHLRIQNILHDNKLWETTVEIDAVSSSEVFTMPLVLGQFHFAAGFSFKHPIVLHAMAKEDRGRSITVDRILLSTGPTVPMSMGAVTGKQNITARAQTVEQFAADHPKATTPDKIASFTHQVNPDRVILGDFLVAFAEEATRLAFLQDVRTGLIDAHSGDDPLTYGRYTLYNDNCVSSGARNLAIGIRPEFRAELLQDARLKLDMTGWTGSENRSEVLARMRRFTAAQKQIDPWMAGLRRDPKLALDMPPLDLGQLGLARAALEEEVAYKNLIGGKMMSLAWPKRAMRLIDFATTQASSTP